MYDYNIAEEIDEITVAGYMDQAMDKVQKNSSEKFSTLELAKRFPVAFNALPEAYRNDDVLIFWFSNVRPVNKLCFKVKEDQEFAIGKLAGFFNEFKQCFTVRDEQGNWRNIDPKE